MPRFTMLLALLALCLLPVALVLSGCGDNAGEPAAPPAITGSGTLSDTDVIGWGRYQQEFYYDRVDIPAADTPRVLEAIMARAGDSDVDPFIIVMKTASMGASTPQDIYDVFAFVMSGDDYAENYNGYQENDASAIFATEPNVAYTVLLMDHQGRAAGDYSYLIQDITAQQLAAGTGAVTDTDSVAGYSYCDYVDLPVLPNGGWLEVTLNNESWYEEACTDWEDFDTFLFIIPTSGKEGDWYNESLSIAADDDSGEGWFGHNSRVYFKAEPGVAYTAVLCGLYGDLGNYSYLVRQVPGGWFPETMVRAVPAPKH